jgi:hypothetical protein
MSKFKVTKRMLFIGTLFVSMGALFTACEEPDVPEHPDEVYYEVYYNDLRSTNHENN